MMRYFSLLLLFSISLCAITISPSTQKIDHFTLPYFYDVNNTSTIQTVQMKDFNQTISNQYSFGYTKASIWFKFTINNTSDKEDFILYCLEPNLDHVDLYTKQNGLWVEEKNGLSVPFKKRTISTANPAFNIHIKAHQSTTIYVKSSTSLSNIGNFQIYTREAFLVGDNYALQSVYFFFLGGCVVIAFLNIFLFFRLKESMYAYYVGYVISLGLFVMVFSGTNQMVGLENLRFLFLATPSLLGVFLTLFTIKFLNVSTHSPILYNILRFLSLVMGVLALLITIDQTPWYTIMNNVTTLVFIALVYTAVYVWFKGNTLAKSYLFIMLINIIGLGMMANVYTNDMPNNYFTLYTFVATSFLEISFFSLILANRINDELSKKIKLQNESIKKKKAYQKNLEHDVKLRTQELEIAQELLIEQAHKDSLTNLYNRRHFTKLALQNFEQTQTDDGVFSLFMIDIDFFKKINDNYGHQVGDLALQFIVKHIVEAFKKSAIIGRYGGEEFIVLVPDCNKEEALIEAENLRSSIESSSLKLDDNSFIKMTVSIGIAPYQKSCTLDTLIQRADKGLYEAKDKGRNQVVLS